MATVTMELTEREAEAVRRMRLTPAERRAWYEQVRAEALARVEAQRAQETAAGKEGEV